jgi:hypothetical protein
MNINRTFWSWQIVLGFEKEVLQEINWTEIKMVFTVETWSLILREE